MKITIDKTLNSFNNNDKHFKFCSKISKTTFKQNFQNSSNHQIQSNFLTMMKISNKMFKKQNFLIRDTKKKRYYLLWNNCNMLIVRGKVVNCYYLGGCRAHMEATAEALRER